MHVAALPRTHSTELAEAAATGNPESIAKLLRVLAPGMVRAAQACLGRLHPDVDDVSQQSMIALIQALPSFRGECSPEHFAHCIVLRIALAARRKNSKTQQRTESGVDVDALHAHAETAVEQVAAQKRRFAIRQLLDRLPLVQAETLALRVVLGMSLAEVAAATQVPLNTVRSRIRLAKEALLERIQADPSLLELLDPSSC
jgi:RNA polymerase sigma-70 factor (ECF subfamily)